MKLNIPEILLEIFSYLKDLKPSLHAIIQVNHVWFRCGISFLWNLCTSPMRTLAKVPASRRQIYAQHIRNLTIRANDTGFDVSIPGMSRLNLAKLTLCDYNRELTGLHQIRRYMPPSLQELRLVECLIDPPLMSHLAGTCQQLRTLSIDMCAVKPPLSILKLLENLDSLEAIDLETHMEGDDINRVLEHMPCRGNLKSLEIGSHSVEFDQSKLSADTPDTFPAMESLSLITTVGSVSGITQLFQHIEKRLCLIIKNSGDSFLGQLTNSFTHLRALELSLQEGMNIPRTELLSLTSLTHLEELRIAPTARGGCPYHGGTVTSHEFADIDLSRLVCQLPHIRRFELNIEWGVSGAGLDAIARHFPHLESLELNIPFNPHDLREFFALLSTPRFAVLKTLILVQSSPDLYEATLSRQEDAYAGVQLLIEYMPNLEAFRAFGSSTFAGAIESQWMELTGAAPLVPG